MNDEPIYPEAEFVYDPPPAFDRLSKFGMSETSRDALIFEFNVQQTSSAAGNIITK